MGLHIPDHVWHVCGKSRRRRLATEVWTIGLHENVSPTKFLTTRGHYISIGLNEQRMSRR
jgi:hypothetical protein